MKIEFKKQTNGSLLITGPDGSIEVVKPPKGELDDKKMAQFALDLGRSVMEIMAQPDVPDQSEQAAPRPPKEAPKPKAKTKAEEPDVTIIEDGLDDDAGSQPQGGGDMPTSGEDLVNTVAYGLFGEKGLAFVKGLQNLSE